MARTQAELAELVGYSRVTVSKALSGHPSVLPATRDRIMAKAREVGYRPNAAALQMRSGRFHAAALLTSAQADRSYLPAYLYKGVQHALTTHDMIMTMTEVPDAVLDRPNDAPRILRELSADGLLVDFCSDVPGSLNTLVDALGMPSVWLNFKRSINAVYPDDVMGGRLATTHLLEAGHTRIGYLCTAGMQRHYSTADRYAGYAAVMAHAGLTPINLCPREHWARAEERFAAIREILQQPDRPTAMVVYERRELIALYHIAAEMRLRIGEDLSVVLISDDTHDLVDIPPAIAVIPFEAVGRQAVEMLLRRIDEPAVDQPCEAVPFGEVVPGQSVGRAPMLQV